MTFQGVPASSKRLSWLNAPRCSTGNAEDALAAWWLGRRVLTGVVWSLLRQGELRGDVRHTSGTVCVADALRLTSLQVRELFAVIDAFTRQWSAFDAAAYSECGQSQEGGLQES